MGYLYQQQGLQEQARVEFWKAIEKEPFDPKAYRHLADLLVAQGDFQEATRVYRLAARDNPGLAWPRLALGSLHVQENRLAEAKVIPAGI